MPQLVKEEKGVVSIAMAIIIPVIIFGVFYIYALLDKPLQENTAHKIVYASSEAYLSRYNAYLFEQMGLLANLDNDSLEPLIMHYLMKNELIVDRDSVNMAINFEQLSTPGVFHEAVNEAASILIGNAFVDYGVNLLDQFTFAENIRSLNQNIHNYEKKLSEQFDKIVASQFLRAIEACRDVQSGRRELDALKNHLYAQNDAFFKTFNDLLSVSTNLKETIDDTQQSMKSFVESKETQWRELERTFLNDQRDYLLLTDLIETSYGRIESDEASVNELTAQIESEKLKRPLNLKKIDQLIASRAENEGAISEGYTVLASIISKKLSTEEVKPPSMIQGLKQLLLEAEYLFSGIEIGSGALDIDVAYKHSVNDSYDAKFDTVTKVKMNEYFLSIFSSYDLNCPRVFDPQNRLNTLRCIKGEAEYLISGLVKEKQSISLVRLKIVTIRSAANLVTLTCDKDKLARLSTATVAIPQPWRSLAYGAAIVAWSGVESYSDINRLMKGEGFHFLKTQSQWATDFDGLFDGSWKNKVNAKQSKLPTDSKQPTESKHSVLDPNMYYLDYIRLLLLIQDEETTLLRAMDLVEAELIDTSEGKTTLANLSRGHNIDLTWNVQGIFGLFSEAKSTIHMRNGFE